MKRYPWLMVGTVAGGLLLALGSSQAGGQDKKPILSDEQFSKFVAADAKFLSDALAKDKIDKKMARKIQAAAVMISAFAECSNHPDSQSAFYIAEMLLDRAKAEDWQAAKTVAATLYPKIAMPPAKVNKNKEIVPYMYFFASERVGGFGVEQELGSFDDPKEKITAAQFARLTDLGYKIAVIGQVAERFGPEKDKGAMTRKNWQAFAADMRQTALGLAKAAAAKSEANTRQALVELDSSCTKCHDVFR